MTRFKFSVLKLTVLLAIIFCVLYLPKTIR